MADKTVHETLKKNFSRRQRPITVRTTLFVQEIPIKFALPALAGATIFARVEHG
jgi:hypothetical protein